MMPCEVLPQFFPVIFANGEDDDSYGIAACIGQKQPVQMDGRVYNTGEHIVLEQRRLRFERGVKITDRYGAVVLWLGGTKDPLEITCDRSRFGDSAPFGPELRISNSHIDCTGGVAYFHPNSAWRS